MPSGRSSRTLPSRLSPLTAPRPSSRSQRLSSTSCSHHALSLEPALRPATPPPVHISPPLAHTASASLSPHRAPLAHKSTSGSLKERSRRSSKPARTPSPSRRPAYVTSLPSPLARLLDTPTAFTSAHRPPCSTAPTRAPFATQVDARLPGRAYNLELEWSIFHSEPSYTHRHRHCTCCFDM